MTIDLTRAENPDAVQEAPTEAPPSALPQESEEPDVAEPEPIADHAIEEPTTDEEPSES